MCDDGGSNIGLATKPERLDDPDGVWRKRSRMMSLDPLLAAARFLSTQEEVHRSAVGFIGYGATEPGDRVLVLVDTEYDPRIPDAVAHALRERGARVDVAVEDAGPERTFDEVTELEAIIRREPLRENPRRWDPDHPMAAALHKAIGYDLIVHGKGGAIPTPGTPSFRPDENPDRFEGIPWLDGDIFASDVTTFPREVHTLLNLKVWDLIWNKGRGGRVHLTDPEGTEASWTLHRDYYVGVRQGFKETPLWGHLLMHPTEPILPVEDVRGTYAGTTNHFSSPFPRIEVEIEAGRVQEVRGGGKYGEAWRRLEEETRSIQYPGFPGPGLFWLCETAMGTHPKITRPENMHLLSSGGFEVERRRAGYIHAGFGTIWRSASERWAGEERLPYGHLHIHLHLPTLTLQCSAGEFTIVEDGHLTLLDDPEVRDVASRYGDPDEVLSESWMPAIPGINDEGSYEEYAQDPCGYFYGDAN